jgi:hypothetical protein
LNDLQNQQRHPKLGVMVEKKKAIEILEELRSRVVVLLDPSGGPEFMGWRTDFEAAARNIFPNESSLLARVNSILNPPQVYSAGEGANLNADALDSHTRMRSVEAVISSMIDEVRTYRTDDGLVRMAHTAQPAATADSARGQIFIPVAIQESLEDFQKDYPLSEKVAFVMMQFGDTPAHTRIEETIKATLTKYGFAGVLARDKEYNEEMLANIQTYMHGCGFGIAVIERIQQENFNPNVSLEVGYMMGLKRKVLLLKDQTLKALQTDLVGRLYRPFDVLDPANTIPKHIEEWMEDKGLI